MPTISPKIAQGRMGNVIPQGRIGIAIPQVPRASPKRPMVKLSQKQIMQSQNPARVPMNKGVMGSAVPRSKNVMYKK